jgi:GNAT superfamily N-acetyltransferase
MLQRTADADLVNGILRDAFENEAIDVSAVLANPANYALVRGEGVVLFRATKEPGHFKCSMGLRESAQGAGLGAPLLRDAIAWMFAATEAQTISGVVDPANAAISKITGRLKDAEHSRASGQRLGVSCTREHFAALLRGGHV